jgi:transcriptional regulator with XRE-family HTH domain
MPTRKRPQSKPKSQALRQLEAIAGGPISLAMLVRSIREGEAWSLADLAEKLGVTRGHVAAIEHGKPVSPEAAARYARALGYSEPQFVQLALQDQVKRAGLRYTVALRAA